MYGSLGMGGPVEECQVDDFWEDGVHLNDIAVLDDGFEVAKFLYNHLSWLGGEGDVSEGDYHGFYLALVFELPHQVFDKPAYFPDDLLGGFTLGGRKAVSSELDGELLEDFIEVVIESVALEGIGQVGGVAGLAHTNSIQLLVRISII